MVRFDRTKRRSVEDQIPPRICSGTSSQTGNPCKRHAVVGAEVCPTHGGSAPQVKAAAERRVTLAQAFADHDHRPPWEILADATHLADVIMRQALTLILDEGKVTPKQFDHIVTALERAHRLAKTTLDAGVDERRTRLAEAQAGQLHALFTKVMQALHLTPEQKALVPGVLEREIRAATKPVIQGRAISSTTQNPGGENG